MLQSRWNGPTGSRKIFLKKMVFTIFGHSGHLGNVVNFILMHVHFLVPESLHTKSE